MILLERRERRKCRNLVFARLIMRAQRRGPSLANIYICNVRDMRGEYICVIILIAGGILICLYKKFSLFFFLPRKGFFLVGDGRGGRYLGSKEG